MRQDELPGRADRTQAPEEQATTQQPPEQNQTEEAEAVETAEPEQDSSAASAAPTSAAEEPLATDGDYRAFLTPSNNVVCVMRAEWSACQIFEKDYLPDEDEVAGPDDGCVASDADTLRLYPGSTAEWACMIEPLLANAQIDMGGSWAASDSERVTITGQEYAVLPYGSELTLGEMSCESDNGGVQCTDAAGHGFRLARATYELY